MKNLLLVLSLVITASPAFASRARLEALGENKNGSYYVNDGRNMFLNPAAINGYKKKLFLELGNADGVADSAAAPKVQGGFTNTFGDFVYGLYMGKESDRSISAVLAANTTFGGGTYINADHAFDFFFGGDNGFKWGANVFYAGALSQTAATKKTASILAARLGVEVNSLSIFTTIGLSSSFKNATASTTTDSEVKGNLNLDVGATYGMDDMTYFAKMSMYGSDFTNGTATALAGTTATTKTTAFGLGAGWKKEASKSVTMYSRVQLDYQTDAVTGVAALASKNTYYAIPVVVSAEAQATSWLTIRGSVSHALLAQHQNGQLKDSMDNATTVAAGLGLNFGDLNIDAIVGQAAASTAGGNTESSMNNVASGPKFGFGDQMMTRVGMTYNF